MNDVSPDVALVRQELFSAPIDDVGASVTNALSGLSLDEKTRPGQTVAVVVGSRKINAIDRVTSLCVAFLKSKGFKPFIVPGMGSHGGATSQGQTRVLESLGITEKTVGAPIRAEMDAKKIGELASGTPVFFSSAALLADHIVPINRVKLHTKFSAPIESGLCKMLAIGLGKEKGATAFHRAAVSQGFGIVEEAAGLILDKTPVLFGLALLEDGLGKLSRVRAVRAHELIAREKELLKKASAMMARIPFDNLDVLVVDWVGKDISGIGMDSNVTGRHRDVTGDFFLPPCPRRIFARDLSPGSDGNANGIGLADVTTRRLIEAVDLKKTYTNALAAVSPEKAALPLHFETDQEALAACINTCGSVSPEKTRLVRVHSTARLETFLVSACLEPEVAAQPGLCRITEYAPILWDESGNMRPL